jgi:hypothetical protein
MRHVGQTGQPVKRNDLREASEVSQVSHAGGADLCCATEEAGRLADLRFHFAGLQMPRVTHNPSCFMMRMLASPVTRLSVPVLTP